MGQTQDGTDKVYDLVIVGGGTAGCLLASRLSSLSHLTILLIEAGQDHIDDPKVTTPLLSGQMFGDPEYDWCFKTTPQPALGGRVIHQTRGRMIGGSSAINSHSLVYPNGAMHDTWAELVGCRQWSWESMAAYYERFIEEQPQSGQIKDAELPRIKASYPAPLNTLQQAWERVFDELGMTCQKPNLLGEAIGGVTTTNAIDKSKGARSFAGNALLAPVKHRNNLVIETGATVQRIDMEHLPDNSSSTTGAAAVTKRAVGVLYERSGITLSVKARLEVILCAGTFGSPQILELSGIGNPSILKKAGVDCNIDLPGVGENLQDHLNFGPSVEVDPSIETVDIYRRDPAVAQAWRTEYEKYKSGPISEGGAYNFAYWPLQLFNSNLEEEQLRELLRDSATAVPHKGLELQYDFIRRMILHPREASATAFMTRVQRYTTPEARVDGNFMSVIAMLSHPFSRGSVHIKSPECLDPPIIDCAYLSHPLDSEMLALHVTQIERLLRQPSFDPIIRNDGRRLPPGLDATSSLSDIKQAIENYGATNYHPCGTCAMMKAEYGGVVDGDLRVYGTENLRVCDASIFPIIPRGNILTTVYAVAEKAADILGSIYGQSPSQKFD